MTFLPRAFLALAITSSLFGCNTEIEPTLPLPIEPIELEPEAPKNITLNIGNAEVAAVQQSVVINDNNGEQKLVNIETFKGIVFANSERFQHSKLAKFQGEVDARSFAASCPQAIDKTKQAISEACLHLNIWRPVDTPANANLPVYVFIHGGDFEYGSGAEPIINGDKVVAQHADEETGIIYVTFNYRLGLLGSYWIDNETQPEGGNFGLGDQQRALEWVQEYIEEFGGDRNNVTLMGQGSGAMSVGILQQQHAFNNSTSSYFQRAIMQSNPFGFEYKNYDAAASYRKKVCKEFDVYGLLNCSSDADEKIKQKSLEEIMTAQSSLLNPVDTVINWLSANILGDKNVTPMHHFMPFAPYIEANDQSTGEYFSAQPSLSELNVPTVLGGNTDESNSFGMLPSLTFLAPMIISELCAEENIELPDLLCGNEAEVLSETDIELFTEAYIEWINTPGHLTRLKQKVTLLSSNELNSETLPLGAYSAIIQLLFGLNNSEETEQLLSLTDYYPENESDLTGATKNMATFKMLLNDTIFNGPSRQVVIESALSGNNTIFYQFNAKPSFNVWGASTGLETFKSIGCLSGTCNSAELPFIFNKAMRIDGSEIKPNSKELALMEELSRLWFSDELFYQHQYDVNQDNVLMINGAAEIVEQTNWDHTAHPGIDPKLRQGRLQGLTDLGLMIPYIN